MIAIYVTYLIEDHFAGGKKVSAGTVINTEFKTAGVALAVADQSRMGHESIVRYTVENDFNITRLLHGSVDENRNFIKCNEILLKEDKEASITFVARIEDE